jgi:hypothetical protein
VARNGEERVVHRVLVRNLRERGYWGDPDVDERIILRGIFRKFEGVVGTGWSWLRMVDTCEYGKTTSGSIKIRGIS